MSSSLATSVTPDHPRRDNNSITEMALSTDCTKGLLRTTAHISADPTPPSVSWLDPLVSPVWTTGRSTSWARCYQNVLMSSFLVKERGRPSCWSSGCLSPEPVEAEEGDVVAGKSSFGEVGHDLTDDAGELETVSRAGRGDGDLRVVRVQVQDEVVVGGVGEHAGLQVHGRAGAV